uniref:AT3G22550 protein n=1 Tax=Arabidopsis thaliana TaxID=3702 RepID=C0Z368_ARATH|nr:AT3G22550 [Arabidopsis thaliana]
MLKKRSRSKQALMAETNQSQNQKQSKTTPFPRLFTAFSSFKSFTENDAVASPTSILDTKPFSVVAVTVRRVLGLVMTFSCTGEIELSVAVNAGP